MLGVSTGAGHGGGQDLLAFENVCVPAIAVALGDGPGELDRPDGCWGEGADLSMTERMSAFERLPADAAHDALLGIGGR